MTNPFSPGALSQPIPSTDGPSDPFDANAFMQQTVEGVGSVTVTPIPGRRYIALIGNDEKDVQVTAFTNRKTQEQGLRLAVTFNLIDDDGMIKTAIDGRDPKITDSFFLDTIPGSYRLDMGKGKNVRLNRLRAAVGQNTGGPWGIPMLKGAGPLILDIVVEPDRETPDVPRNRIKAYGQVTSTGFAAKA